MIPEGMHEPDWDRYNVPPPGKVAQVGDPTRWGAQAFTRLVANQSIFSEQLLVLSTRDGYARNWAIEGTVTLPLVTWAAPATWGAVLTVAVMLEITMGVGQIQITHRMILAGGGQATIGLCNQQYVANGGPYVGRPETSPGGTPDDSEVRSFAAIGSLVGQSINVRALYFVGVAVPGVPSTSRLAVLATPFAAGEGL